jgi:hypothetical protein
MIDMLERHENLKGFPERVYVSDQRVYNEYGNTVVSQAFEDLDNAVNIGQPVEVGIYQLVRVAKFQKTAVEVKTLKEVKDDITKSS